MSFTDFLSSNVRTELENEILSDIQRTVSTPWSLGPFRNGRSVCGAPPTPERGRCGPPVNKGRGLRKYPCWRRISLAFYKVQVKSSPFLLHFSHPLVKSWWLIADPKPTTKFVYSFIKAKVQFSTHFSALSGLLVLLGQLPALESSYHP